jgi:hypothetical protein
MIGPRPEKSLKGRIELNDTFLKSQQMDLSGLDSDKKIATTTGQMFVSQMTFRQKVL